MTESFKTRVDIMYDDDGMKSELLASSAFLAAHGQVLDLAGCSSCSVRGAAGCPRGA